MKKHYHIVGVNREAVPVVPTENSIRDRNGRDISRVGRATRCTRGDVLGFVVFVSLPHGCGRRWGGLLVLGGFGGFGFGGFGGEEFLRDESDDGGDVQVVGG